MARLYEHEPNQEIAYNDDPLKFSDDEDEYNYYTGSDDEEFERFAEQENYSRIRAFTALLLPLLVSASVGMFLYKKQVK